MTKPTIDNKKPVPNWLQQMMKEDETKAQYTNQNLGKPSSRQDAIILAEWFKKILDLVE